MNPRYLDLSNLDLALAAALIAINGALSLALRLGLEKRLAIAALRPRPGCFAPTSGMWWWQ
jgi:putative ABC transport system permease protein